MLLEGLQNFKLTHASFRRLGDRKVLAHVDLGTYDVTPAVRKLPPSKRFAYLASRVNRWIHRLYSRHPRLSFRQKQDKVSHRIPRRRRWSELPDTIVVRGAAREVLGLRGTAGVSSVYIARVAGCRRRLPRSPLVWYCVRAFVVIRVEREKSGMQMTEDRFILVRASSSADAEKRLKQVWRKYATPYLNSEGKIVSSSLDRVVDVYDTGETEIDPTGTEVYSKLGERRMRPKYVWRPQF